MHQIIPLENISREDLRDLARAAVESGESLDHANRWRPGTDRHRQFEHDYLDHQRAMNDALTT